MIKQGGAGIEDIKKRNALMQFLGEVQFLISNWKVRALYILFDVYVENDKHQESIIQIE